MLLCPRRIIWIVQPAQYMRRVQRLESDVSKSGQNMIMEIAKVMFPGANEYSPASSFGIFPGSPGASLAKIRHGKRAQCNITPVNTLDHPVGLHPLHAAVCDRLPVEMKWRSVSRL